MEEIDLTEMIKYFWKKKMWIIVVGILCVVLAVIYSKCLATPEYISTSQFILTNNKLETEAEVYSYAKLPDRYFAITDSVMVLEKVVKNLKLDVEDIFEFKEEHVEITHSPSSFLITVTANTDDAKKSAQIANEFVKVAIEEIKKVYNDEDIKILDSAVENWNSTNINMVENVIKVVMFGEILVCGCIVIRYILVVEKKKSEKNL